MFHSRIRKDEPGFDDSHCAYAKGHPCVVCFWILIWDDTTMSYEGIGF